MTVTVNGEDRYTWPVSTGRSGYDTPSGEFQPFRMEKDHFSREWDDAPMPNSIFFTKIGHAIHGTFEARNLGRPASHGCVRLSTQNAAILYAIVKQEGVFNTRVKLTGQAPKFDNGDDAVARRGNGRGYTTDDDDAAYAQAQQRYYQTRGRDFQYNGRSTIIGNDRTTAAASFFRTAGKATIRDGEPEDSDDPQTLRRQISTLFAQEKSSHRQASQSRHFLHQKSGAAARAPGPVFQAPLKGDATPRDAQRRALPPPDRG